MWPAGGGRGEAAKDTWTGLTSSASLRKRHLPPSLRLPGGMVITYQFLPQDSQTEASSLAQGIFFNLKFETFGSIHLSELYTQNVYIVIKYK